MVTGNDTKIAYLARVALRKTTLAC